MRTLFRSVSAIALAAAALSAHGADYTGPGGAILDGTSATPVTSSFTIAAVPALASVSSITLTGLTHTYAGDLTARVVAPGGASVTLFQKINSNLATDSLESSDFGGTYVFAVGGASIWTAASAVGATTAIAPGTYQPSANNFTGTAAAPTGYVATNYSAFANAAAGAWTLQITDGNGGDVGNLASWTITAAPVPEPSALAALGLGAAAMLRRRKRA